MITPSRLQEPKTTGRGASHMVCAGPPEISIFLSFPAALKATKRLSGDQKGAGNATVLSVPGRGRVSSESIERSHRRAIPSEPYAAKARRRPSGDNAKNDSASRPMEAI